MTRKEKILHIVGDFDVRSDGVAFTVYRNGITHAASVQTFADQTHAIAYANYKAGLRGKETLRNVGALEAAQ
jgi:hypothetical protein